MRHVIPAILLLAAACASAPPARRYASPEQAVAALLAAARSGSPAAAAEVFGSGADEVFSSGDPVQDAEASQSFAASLEKKHSLEEGVGGSLTLVVGEKNWPFPVPLVQDAAGWSWDVESGRDEILTRRIGRNELDAIQVCLALADAQQDYAALRIDGVAQYARRILSEPGKKNGLYWKTAPGEPASPLGPLAAEAAEEGYSGTSKSYHGYRFRVLSRQGPAARGGERDYAVGDRMIGGFAFAAFPAEYGKSGIMTFIVNHDGKVFQRDLGEDTARSARALEAFDPVPGWVPAKP
jgi:hypothetical protein